MMRKLEPSSPGALKSPGERPRAASHETVSSGGVSSLFLGGRQRATSNTNIAEKEDIFFDVDPDTGKSVLRSSEEDNMEEVFNNLERETKSLRERIDSRKNGYDSFKQAKKQASAVKNALRFAFKDVVSFVTKGLRAEKVTKKDEFAETAAMLLSQHEALYDATVKNRSTAIELQSSLIEQANYYESRMLVCLEHNMALSRELQVSSRKVFDYLSEVDHAIRALKGMNAYVIAVSELADVPSKRAEYVPWTLRATVDTAKIAETARKEQEKKIAAEDKKELDRRMNILSSARDNAGACLKSLMNDKMELETVMGSLRAALRALKLEKAKMSKEGFPIPPGASADEAKYDHSSCQDCMHFPDICQHTTRQIEAAFCTAVKVTRRIEQLIVQRVHIDGSKADIDEFNDAGDLETSYSGPKNAASP